MFFTANQSLGFFTANQSFRLLLKKLNY